MPGKKRLEEAFEQFTAEEIKQQVETKEADLKKAKSDIYRMKIKVLWSDIFYVLVMSVLLGFILWSLKPETFTYYKGVALGLLWYLLFEELRLQNMFKK